MRLGSNLNRESKTIGPVKMKMTRTFSITSKFVCQILHMGALILQNKFNEISTFSGEICILAKNRMAAKYKLSRMFYVVLHNIGHGYPI